MTLHTGTMKLYAPGAAVTSPKATLTKSKARSWTGHLNDAGGGTFTLNLLEADAAQVAHDDWVRCFVDGTVRFTWIVEHITRKLVGQGEAAEQVMVVSGRGFSALLDHAVVYPPFGVRPLRSTDTRQFGYMGASYDASGWASSPPGNQLANDPSGTDWANAPKDWPDVLASAYWIWVQPIPSEQVTGDGYFRNQAIGTDASFTLAAPTTVRWFVATDNGGQVWLDETIIDDLAPNPDPVGWNTFRAVDTDLDAGDHLLAIKCTNFGPFVGFNPGGVIVGGVTITSGGAELGSVVIQTTPTSDWRYLDRPASVPGSTPGRIMDQMLTEAQTRGCFPGLSWDFDDALDSDGNAWTSTTDTSTQVGAKYLGLLQQLAETYCDFYWDADFPVLHVVNALGSDLSGSVTLAPQVNLTALEVVTSSQGLANAMPIRHAAGYSEATDSGSISTHGRREEMLSLGQQPTESQVSAIASALFARISDPEMAVTAAVAAAGPVGFVDYKAGDSITCTGDAGPASMRVIAITAVVDDSNGVLSTTPELQTLKEEIAVNLARQVNRMIPGSLPSSLS